MCMKLVDSISNHISQTLFDADSISKEEVPIYNYCLSYFFESLIYCICILFSALITGQLWNGVLIILVFIPLKIFAGGYHAKTQKQCYFFSYGVVWCILFLSPYLYNYNVFTTSWIILYTICSILIVCLAPIDTPNKRIKREEKKSLKKWTFRYMLFLTTLNIILLLTKCYQHYIILVICVCIINGNQIIGFLANKRNQKGKPNHDLKSSTM